MKYFYLFLSLFIIVSFGLKESIFEDNYVLVLPNGFPEPYIPLDNKLTQSRVELGRQLFFDVRLSRNNSLACASCHNPKLAFTDGSKLSIGNKGELLSRNAPTLTNIAYQDSGLLFDRGVPTLEMQILVPIQEHKEFDFNIHLIAERLKKDTSLQNLSIKAYHSEITPFVITRAIAAFERTLISGDSPYDKFNNGDSTALTNEQQLGMTLFFNTLNCTECHSGFNFTNNSLQNNGLYTYPYPLDSGRMRVTALEEDRDLFKVPTLRNISVTAPYMHDGSIPNLEGVIEHYNSGGHEHSNKSGKLTPLELNSDEKRQLILFLETLTDTSFINKVYQ
jgi:cytochrome c peroxidase